MEVQVPEGVKSVWAAVSGWGHWVRAIDTTMRRYRYTTLLYFAQGTDKYIQPSAFECISLTRDGRNFVYTHSNHCFHLFQNELSYIHWLLHYLSFNYLALHSLNKTLYRSFRTNTCSAVCSSVWLTLACMRSPGSSNTSRYANDEIQ